MEKVKIVTDSTCYMPKTYLEQYGIEVVPLYVRFGDEVLMENEVNFDDFYKRVRSSNVLPETTQPSPEDFERVYRKYIDEGYDIISIHISAGMSGTINSANAAKEALKSDKIHIFDSKFTSMGLGFQILEIARMLYEENYPLDKVLEEIPGLAKHMNIYFLVDDLFWLARLGRIGKARAVLGTWIKVKPILYFDDGVVNVLEQPRTTQRGKERMFELMKEKIDKLGLKYITVVYGDNLQEAEEYRDFLERELNRSISLTQLGPVIGTHTGPGVLSIHFYTERI